MEKEDPPPTKVAAPMSSQPSPITLKTTQLTLKSTKLNLRKNGRRPSDIHFRSSTNTSPTEEDDDDETRASSQSHRHGHGHRHHHSRSPVRSHKKREDDLKSSSHHTSTTTSSSRRDDKTLKSSSQHSRSKGGSSNSHHSRSRSGSHHSRSKQGSSHRHHRHGSQHAEETSDPSTTRKFSDHYKIISDDHYSSSSSAAAQHLVHVHVCVHLQTKQRFSVKIVNTAKLSRWNKERPLVVEASSLKLWHSLPAHASRLQLHDWFQGKGHTYLVLDEWFANQQQQPKSQPVKDNNQYQCTTLVRTVEENSLWLEAMGGAKKEPFVQRILYQLLQALEDLHLHHKIVHCDLRLENVLLLTKHGEDDNNENFLVKLKGFGACVKDHDTLARKILNRTTHYTAPEICATAKHCPTKTKKAHAVQDLWSVGVIAFFLLAQKLPPHPQDADSPHDYQRQLQGEAIWSHLSLTAREFCTKCLQYDPKKRWKIDKALQHPWIVSYATTSLQQNSVSEKASTTATANQSSSLANIPEEKPSVSSTAAPQPREGQAGSSAPSLPEEEPNIPPTTSRRTNNNPLLKSMNTLNRIQSFQAPENKLQQAALMVLASQNLVKEKKKKIEQAFLALDASSNDSKLDRNDIETNFERVFGYALSPDEVDDLFSRLDTSGDGTIDYAEFVVASLNESVLLGQEDKLRQAFHRFDIDGTGKVSVANLQRIFHALPVDDLPTDPKVIQQLLKQADLDGDGFLSYDEFVAMMVTSSDTATNSVADFADGSCSRGDGLVTKSSVSNESTDSVVAGSRLSEENQKQKISSNTNNQRSDSLHSDAVPFNGEKGNGSLSTSDHAATLLPSKPDFIGTNKENLSQQVSKKLKNGHRPKLRFSSIDFSGHADTHTKFYRDYRVIQELPSPVEGDATRNKVQWLACRHRKTGVERVVKVIAKSSRWIAQDEYLLACRREYHIVSKLDHPGIAQVHELYDGEEHCYLVMDYCFRSLFQELEVWGALPEAVASQVMKQILSCLDYLHSPGDDGRCLIHCNLRPEHMLLSEQSPSSLSSIFSDDANATEQLRQAYNQVKLVGFGQSAKYHPESGIQDTSLVKSTANKRQSIDGNVDYELLLSSDSNFANHLNAWSPPEVRESRRNWTPQGDLYSCGVLAFGMVSKLDLLNNAEARGIEVSDIDWEGMSESCRDFIAMLLVRDPSKRPSAREALQHPWICNSVELNSPGSDLYSKLVMVRFNGESHLKKACLCLLESQIELNKTVKVIRRIFESLGFSINDQLSRKQVQRGYSRFRRSKLTESQANNLFDLVDVEKAGFIEAVEFIVACLNEQNLLSNQRMKTSFVVWDMKGTGRIENTHLCEVLGHYLNTNKVLPDNETTTLERMVQVFAAHGDGQVSFDDVQGMMVKAAFAASRAFVVPGALQNLRGAALVRCGNFERVRFTLLGHGTEYTRGSAALTDDYEIGRYISVGQYICTDKRTQSKHILKIIDKSHLDSKNQQLFTEVGILNTLIEQPNVALVNDFFERDSQFYVVFENYGDGGTLADELDTFGCLSERDASVFFRQLLSCISFCHAANITHRDLTVDKIMLSLNADIDHFKIADFASATFFNPKIGMMGKVGTPGYMAPEIAHGRYNEKCDIWSIGVIAYLCLAKKVSFQIFVADVKHLIENGKLAFEDPSWDAVSRPAKDFISSLLTWNEKDRPTAELALQNAWLKSNAACVERPQAIPQIREGVTEKMQRGAVVIIQAFANLRRERHHLDKSLQELALSPHSPMTPTLVKEAYAKVFSEGLDDKDVDELFLRLDIEGVGHILYWDFMIAVLNQRGVLHSDQLAKAISSFDVDGSGTISIVHLKVAMSALHETPLETINHRLVKGLIDCLEKETNPLATRDDIMAVILRATQPSHAEIEGLRFHSTFFVQHKANTLEEGYEIGSFVNEGLFGKVFLCKHKGTGETRALKIRKKTIWDEPAHFGVAEIKILKELDHPNVMPLLDLFIEDGHYCVATEYFEGGDLCTELDENGSMMEDRAATFMKRLLLVVGYIHQHKIVHRDLKPDNIMFPASKKIDQFKLIDFARSSYLKDDERLSTIVTTPEYAAPEVLSCDYGPKADIFSCGVILYLCLSNTFPFDGETREEIHENIESGEYVILENISEVADNFVSILLAYDEDYRPFAEEALQHKWLSRLGSSLDSHGHQEEVHAIQGALDNLRHQQLITPSKLKQATHALIAAQGLVKTEKEEIDKAFLAIDLDHDGKLSKKEVKDGYAAYFGQKLGDEEVDKLFAQVDVDGTGFLEYGEFVIAALNEQDLLRTGVLRRAFQIFDVDNTGKLSKKGLKQVLKDALAQGKTNNEEAVSELIEQVDLDGDGEISFDEFVSMMLMST